MPDFELRADFDHDGRLTGSQSEYDSRQTSPGLVLVANVDNDTRAFPSAVTAGSPLRLDYERYAPSGRDDEFAAITVKFNNPAAAAGRNFFFRVSGIHGVRTSFFDSTGSILTTRVNGEIKDHPFPTPTGPQAEFTLQTRTFPGSPFGFATTMATTYDPLTDAVNQSRFSLQLVSQDAAQNETVHDAGLVTSAPILFLDNGVNATRIYICDKPDTLASLSDVREAVRGIGGLSLVTVPADASGADTWLQDQFQPGIVVGGDTWRHVIVHMPRMRSDFASLRSANNLSSFVTSHFPAHNVGLMNDFWDRSISFSDSNGTLVVVKMPEGIDLANRMNDVFSVLQYLDRIASSVAPTTPAHTGLSWSEARTQLASILTVVRSRIDTATGSDELKAFARRQADDADARITILNTQFPENAAQDGFMLRIGTTTVDVPTQIADDLFFRVQQIQRSANYGGNVESAPPSPGAPLGTIVLGNASIGGSFDHMDPDVRRFFYHQRQPVFEVDTTWLDVGHIDEMLTFVPDRSGSGQSFAALIASSELAMNLVREAFATYRTGLPVNHPNRDDPPLMSPVASRLLNEGTSPVTRLMRGKVWSHTHPRMAASSGLPDILEPPRIYQNLARYYNGGQLGGPASHSGLQIHGIDYLPGSGPDRFYPADISPMELIYMEADSYGKETNDFVELNFLRPAATAVAARFGDPRIFPLPVVFDRVSNTGEWSQNRWAYSTSAFTPDVVNMQVLNGHLIVPRPYGPRMRPADVTQVITNVLSNYDWGSSLSRNLTARFYTRYHLDVTTAWIERHEPSYRPDSTILIRVSDGIRDLPDVAHAFKDGFPGLSQSEVETRIRRANPRNFTPNDDLREGWRKFTLNEGMVDIFEAYIQLVANSLGLTLHFVDSWFYHVHYGGIHCGTNVLREPMRGQIPAWWN
jgi:hypothetical protein